MRTLTALTIMLGLLLTPVHANELSEDDIKALALQAIRENPQIILEAVQLFEEQQKEQQTAQAAEVLISQRSSLERDPNAPVLGNPEGDVTIVEFFDYNCPYCKQVIPEVQALLEGDDNIRLVYREWPILGEGSVFAARAALAARKQGKYEDFHWAMMGLKGRVEEASVLKVASEIGLDIEQLHKDMQAPEVDAHIQTSMELTRALGFNGTPSFVIGDALVPGFVTADELSLYVEEARDASE